MSADNIVIRICAAYDRGYAARSADNPYPECSAEAEAWALGQVQRRIAEGWPVLTKPDKVMA